MDASATTNQIWVCIMYKKPGPQPVGRMMSELGDTEGFIQTTISFLIM